MVVVGDLVAEPNKLLLLQHKLTAYLDAISPEQMRDAGVVMAVLKFLFVS